MTLFLKSYLWEYPQPDEWLPLIYYSMPETDVSIVYYGINTSHQIQYSKIVENNYKSKCIDLSSLRYILPEKKRVWLTPEGNVYIASQDDPIGDKAKVLISNCTDELNQVFTLDYKIISGMYHDDKVSIDTNIKILINILGKSSNKISDYLLYLTKYVKLLIYQKYPINPIWKTYILDLAFECNCQKSNYDFWTERFFALIDDKSSPLKESRIKSLLSKATKDLELINNSRENQGFEKIAFIIGAELKKSEEFSLAALFYEELLQLNPEHHTACYHLGEIYDKLNNFDKSYYYYDKAKSEYKIVYFYLSKLCRDNNKFEEAYSFCKKFFEARFEELYGTKMNIRQKKHSDPVQIHRGMLSIQGAVLRELAKRTCDENQRENYIKQSINSYLLGISRDENTNIPTHHQYQKVLRCGLAQTYVFAKEYKKAEDQLRMLIEKDPTLFAYTCLARIYYEQEKLDLAAQEFRGVIQSNPQHEYSLITLARIEDIKNNVDSAINYCEEVLSVNRSNPFALSMLGELHLKRFDKHFNEKDLSASESYFDRLKEISLQVPRSKSGWKIALTGKAKISKLKGQYKKAEDLCHKVIASDNNDIIAHFELATIYNKLKQYHSAIEECEIIHKINPNDRHIKTALFEYKVKMCLENIYNSIDIEKSKTELLLLIDDIAHEPLRYYEWFNFHIAAMSHLKLGNIEKALQMFEYGVEHCNEEFGKEYFVTGQYLCRNKSQEINSLEEQQDIKQELLALICYNEIWPQKEFILEAQNVIHNLPADFCSHHSVNINRLSDLLAQQIISNELVKILIKLTNASSLYLSEVNLNNDDEYTDRLATESIDNECLMRI